MSVAKNLIAGHILEDQLFPYPQVEAAISKVFASEALQRSAYEALQIAAGSGFMREYPFEQITRDSRILTIFEGTNEVLRLYIALSGLKDLGKSLGELKAAVDDIFNNPIKGFGVLTDYAERRLTQATGVGRDKILSSLPQLLPEAAGIWVRMVLKQPSSQGSLPSRRNGAWPITYGVRSAMRTTR